MNRFFLQIVLDSAQSLGNDNTGLDVIDLATKGGVVVIIIALLSIAAVYISLERYFTIRKASKTDKALVSQIKTLVQNGDIQGAQNICATKNSPYSRMISKGLSRIGKPLEDIRVAVENTGNLEITKLERSLPILATISGAAPMLGFLGTVTGMIKTFYVLSQEGDRIEPGLLSGGIYEAMVTTVAGLIVGIIAYVAYNLLTAKIDRVVYKLESTSMEFLDILNEPAN